MFNNIFNYTKLLLWCGIFYLNFKITDNCNLNLLEILLNNIQKTSSLGTKCIQKLIPYLQVSECKKEILDILKKTYENNLYHSEEYTKKIYEHDFNENMDDKYKIIERISSGSIGQVYKIQDIKQEKYYALKVIHPNIDYHLKFIKNLIWLFNLENHSFFELNEFVKNFEKETCFIYEAYNMKIFDIHYKDNDRIVIPELYKFTKNIIIMEYIEGENIENLDSYERNKYLTFFFLFCNNNKSVINFNHGDMHFGNFKKSKKNIGNNKDKLIVYDFGYCFDIKDNKIVDVLDDFWHGVVGYSKVKYPFKECIDYIIKYHIDQNDISKYEDSINDFFFKEKISSLDELFKKSFTFFTKNKIKLKMEYLNLILVYYHVSNYSDCDMQDLLALCIHYDIFHDYQKILENKVTYKQTSLPVEELMSLL